MTKFENLLNEWVADPHYFKPSSLQHYFLSKYPRDLAGKFDIFKISIFLEATILNFSFFSTPKGSFFSESEIRFLNLPISQKNYSKKLSWAWNLKFPPITVNNLFKFPAQDSDLQYLCEQNRAIWKKSYL